MNHTDSMGRVLGRGTALVFLTAASCAEPTEERGLTGPITPAAAAVSAYDIVKVGASALTIDGNLGDWAGVPAIPTFADDPGNGRGSANNSASVKMAWDPTYLYVAYSVTDTELLAVQTTRDQSALYKDDGVELYLDPQGDGGSATSMQTSDYQFLANVRDVVGDNRGTGTGGKDATFNAVSTLAKSAVNGTLNGGGADVGYTLELRVKWSEIGVTAPTGGNFMRVDLAVDDRDGTAATTEEFDWANLTTTYNNPSAWRDVQLVNTGPVVSAYSLVKVGPSGMTIDGNPSDWAGVAAIPTFADDQGNGRGSANNSASVKMAWNDTYLYAAYTITDTELLALQTTRDANNLYKDDGVELYLDPQGDGGSATSMQTTDYQFLANVRDAVGDSRGNGTGGKDISFNAASTLAKAAANGTLNSGGADIGYTLELRVKWSEIGVTAPTGGNFMRVDLAVDDRDGTAATTEEFDWANLTTTYNNPSAWKDVQLVVDASPPAAPTNPVLTVVSASQINLAWSASTSPDAAGYRIYRGTTSTPTLLTTVAASPFLNTGLTPSTSYTYQVSAVDAAGNESAKSPPTTATTGGPGGTLLRVGLSNFPPSQFGRGPGRDAGAPIYRATTYNPTPSSIAADIALADQHDVLLVLNLAGSRGQWAPGGNYDPALYEAQVRRFQNNAALAGALARRRAVIYVVDEPQHPDFNGTLSPAEVNQMGLLYKSIWPGAVTTVRAPARIMASGDGWDGVPKGATFWSGIDYGWSQYSSNHTPVPSETMPQFFAREKNELAAINLGMIPGLNWWDGGNFTAIDGVNPCWDYLNNGSSSGLVKGTFNSGAPDGTIFLCGQRPANEKRFAASPAIVRRFFDTVWNDPDAPFVNLWTYVYSGFDQIWLQYETRADFVSALDYGINKLANRSAWTGWRPIK